MNFLTISCLHSQTFTFLYILHYPLILLLQFLPSFFLYPFHQTISADVLSVVNKVNVEVRDDNIFSCIARFCVRWNKSVRRVAATFAGYFVTFIIFNDSWGISPLREISLICGIPFNLLNTLLSIAAKRKNTNRDNCDVKSYLLTYQTPMAGDLLLFRMKKQEV